MPGRWPAELRRADRPLYLLGQSTPSQLDDSIYALFAEASLPIIDYWNFKIEDQIVNVPANVIATSVAGVGNGTQFVNCANPLRGLITFNNNDACTQGVTVGNDIARVRSELTNGPEIKASGIDFSLDYRTNDVWGERPRSASPPAITCSTSSRSSPSTACGSARPMRPRASPTTTACRERSPIGAPTPMPSSARGSTIFAPT